MRDGLAWIIEWHNVIQNHFEICYWGNIELKIFFLRLAILREVQRMEWLCNLCISVTPCFWESFLPHVYAIHSLPYLIIRFFSFSVLGEPFQYNWLPFEMGSSPSLEMMHLFMSCCTVKRAKREKWITIESLLHFQNDAHLIFL